MAYPTASDMKVWLRLPAAADAELDGRLAELIAAAVAHVETATGNTFDNASVADTPARISVAVKFLAGFYFENPVPEQKAIDAAIAAVNLLIAGNRVFSFADDNA